MIRRRIMLRPRVPVLLLALAALASASASATDPMAASASTFSGGRLRSNSHRWLYTAKELYEKNTNKEGGNGILLITLGIIAGALSLLGLLFLIDRETFTLLTGVEAPCYCHCSMKKRRIDMDEVDDEPTPYEKDAYLTQETRMYLEDKHDQKVERPKRLLKKVFWCCFHTKDYEGDKYNVPWTGSEDKGETDAGLGAMGRACTDKTVNMFTVIREEIRLRFFWKPTKKFTGDKYAIGEELGDDAEIQMAASSYEEAPPGTTPW